MRVLQLTQYLAMGGLERCVTSLATGLAERGHQSTVAIYENDGLCRSFDDELHAQGVEVHAWQKRAGFSFSTLWRLAKIVRSKKIEIVHSHDLGALIYSVALSFLLFRKIKLIHTQHSFVHFRKGISRYVFYEKFFPRFVSLVCTVSARVLENYRKLGLPENKLAHVSNGIQFPEHFLPLERAREILCRRHPDADVFANVYADRAQQLQPRVLLFLGRVVRGKGLERLTALWLHLPERIKMSWRLLIVGPKNDSDLAEELAANFENSEFGPIFLGATDLPRLFYQSADAFISLSEEEGMPLAVHEALGCGLPVLLSDIGGHRELGAWATLLPAGEPSSQLTAFEEFLNRASGEFDRLAKWNSMEEFRSQFSFDAMVENYLGKYLHWGVAIILLTLSVFLPCRLFAQEAKVLLTQLIERPEYINSSDWQTEIQLVLARGEGTLLTLKTNSFCGTLPRLSSNLTEIGVRLKWYGGVALPVTKPSFEGAIAGNYIDALVPLEKSIPCGNFEWIFAEVSTGRESASGTRFGRLENLLQRDDFPDEVTPQSWALNLTILPLELPEVWSLPLRSEFTPYFASLAHYGRSGREEGELTGKYISEMYENRVLPLKAWIKHPFGSDEEREAANLMLSRYPTRDLSFYTTVMSRLPEWVRFDLPRSDSRTLPERQAYWARWQEYLDSVSEDEIESMMIRRLKNRPFVYLWDEPVQEDLTSLYNIASDVQESAPAISSLVTVYPWESLQEKITIFAPLLQSFVQNGKPQMLAERELWSYVSCMSHGCGSDYSSGEPDFVVERNAAYVRVWPWMAEEYGLSAVLYYSVNNFWRYAKSRDPWKDLFDFTGNGDGTLLYPGKNGTFGLQEHSPVPSLRLKFWKQASFDFEYIRWAKQLNPDCFAKVKDENALVRDAVSWNRDPRRYQRVRDLLIQCIVARKN